MILPRLLDLCLDSTNIRLDGLHHGHGVVVYKTPLIPDHTSHTRQEPGGLGRNSGHPRHSVHAPKFVWTFVSTSARSRAFFCGSRYCYSNAS